MNAEHGNHTTESHISPKYQTPQTPLGSFSTAKQLLIADYWKIWNKAWFSEVFIQSQVNNEPIHTYLHILIGCIFFNISDNIKLYSNVGSWYEENLSTSGLNSF